LHFRTVAALLGTFPDDRRAERKICPHLKFHKFIKQHQRPPHSFRNESDSNEMRRLQPLLSSSPMITFGARSGGRLMASSGVRALATAAPAAKKAPPAFEFEPLFQADPFSATPYRYVPLPRHPPLQLSPISRIL
jgi:hypothetical protein